MHQTAYHWNVTEYITKHHNALHPDDVHYIQIIEHTTAISKCLLSLLHNYFRSLHRSWSVRSPTLHLNNVLTAQLTFKWRLLETHYRQCPRPMHRRRFQMLRLHCRVSSQLRPLWSPGRQLRPSWRGSVFGCVSFLKLALVSFNSATDVFNFFFLTQCNMTQKMCLNIQLSLNKAAFCPYSKTYNDGTARLAVSRALTCGVRSYLSSGGSGFFFDSVSFKQ